MTAVVIIDDSPEDRELLTERIVQAGVHDCVAFQNADAAIDHLNTKSADVIFLDYSLENEVALARIPQLRSYAPGAKLVLITGYDILGLPDLVKRFDVGFMSKHLSQQGAYDAIQSILADAT
ncbi:MAG: response regulator [Pseudomonadota bacterium]